MTPTALIYMCHPVADDISANLARAKRWLRALQDACPDVVVIAPWITMCEIYDDASPEDRATCLSRDCCVVARCDAIALVGGRISGGMQIEMNHAILSGVSVFDMTDLGEEPPKKEILIRSTLRL